MLVKKMGQRSKGCVYHFIIPLLKRVSMWSYVDDGISSLSMMLDRLGVYKWSYKMIHTPLGLYGFLFLGTLYF